MLFVQFFSVLMRVKERKEIKRKRKEKKNKNQEECFTALA